MMNDQDKSHFDITASDDSSGDLDEWKLFIIRLNEQFPTQQHCMEEIISGMYGDEPQPCRSCSTGVYVRTPGSRNGTCPDCGDVVSFTAGTLFHGIRFPRNWLIAVKLMEQGALLSSPRLAKLIGVAQSTAWQMLNKFNSAIELQLPEQTPTMTSSLFAASIFKRSWRSPACSHPVAEQHELEAATQSSLHEETAQSRQSLASLEPVERAIFQLLSERGKLHFDEICQDSGSSVGEVSAALTTLEFANLVQSEGGERFSIREPSKPTPMDKASSQEKFLAAQLISFFTSNFHGISRRYLQAYIAIFWFHWDKQTWKSGTLFKACRYWQAIKQPPQFLVKVMPTSCLLA